MAAGKMRMTMWTVVGDAPLRVPIGSRLLKYIDGGALWIFL